MKSKIPDGLLIIILTSLSYVTSYLYISGYYDYYNIPSIYVEINITNILISLLSLFSLLLVAYILINGIFSLIPTHLKYYKRKLLLKYLIYLLFYASYCYLYQPLEIDFYIFIGIVILFILSDLITPLFSMRCIKGYKHKFICHHTYQSEKNKGNSKEVVKKPSYSILLIMLIIIYVLTPKLGYKHASIQSTHIIIYTEEKSYLLIGTYKSKMIVKEIHNKSKLYEDFMMIELKDNFIFSETKHLKIEQ